MSDYNMTLEEALAKIDRAFGSGAIMRLGDDAKLPVETIPTGSIALDRALGIGGLPRGRIVEIYGPQMSGKTTVALHVIANAQRAGGTCAFIDAEYALDPKYAANLGVDADALLIAQPDTGEQGLEIVDSLIRSGEVSVIVIDSVAALTPRAEIEGDMGDRHVGLQARMMGQAMRKLTGVTSNTNTLVIFLNQIRYKVGVIWGSPETTPGGAALGFYASVRLDVRRGETLKNGDNPVGARAKIKVAKNKLAPPLKTAEFDILWGEGISHEGELVDLGVEHKVLTKSGSWFKYGDRQLAQGRENTRLFLTQNPGTAIEIEERIRGAIAGPC